MQNAAFRTKEIAFFPECRFRQACRPGRCDPRGGHAAIVAGGRYIIQRPGTAEVAFLVVDKYQGQGVGAALRHLANIARDAGLKEFTAEVLPDNVPMLKTFENSGFKLSSKRELAPLYISSST